MTLMTPHRGFQHPITEESFVEEDFGNGIVRAPKDTLINEMVWMFYRLRFPDPPSVSKI